LPGILIGLLLAASGCAPQPMVQPPSGRGMGASPSITRTVLIRVGNRKVMPAPAAPVTPVAVAPATQPVTIAPPMTQPTTAPAVAGTEPADLNPKAKEAFETVAKIMERKGVYKTPDVYVITVPRDDLTILVEGMEVPTAAGLESVFQFYFCSCGKTNVIGQFCVQDYEVNDVIDALRAARIEIASVGPMLLHTRQAPVVIRFFAESTPEPLAKGIREALRWTGKERMPAVGPKAKGDGK
jgi:hypothetical protein